MYNRDIKNSIVGGVFMSFCSNSSQQISINDALGTLSQRELKYLENSWAKDFAEKVFPLIDEHRFSVLYSDNHASRPNNPVNVYLGLLILKEIFGQTDEQAVESLMFDMRYQYALNTTSFKEQPISKNSLSNFRTAVYRYNQQNGVDLIQEEFESHAEGFCRMLNIDGKTIRMDSLMVSSSCRKLSRLALVYSCLKRAVSTVDKAGTIVLPDNLKEYLKNGHYNDTIYRCKDSEVSGRIETVIKDSLEMQGLITNTTLEKSEDAELLNRMLKEQTVQNSDGIEIIESKKIKPESMQNPTDSDATYRTKAGKKHIGYVGNVVESFNEDGGIITQYDLQQNIYSDQHFSEDIITKLGKQDEKITLLVDGAYYADEIAKKAEENNIEMLAGNLVGREPNGDYSLFEIDIENKKVKECIMGYSPKDCKLNGKTYRAHFAKEHCSNCPRRDKCPVVEQKDNFLLQTSEVKYNSSTLRNKLGTAEYRKKIQKRAGVEGIPSILRKIYNVDEIPVMGLVRSKVGFGLKIEAMNVKKCFMASIMKRKRNKRSILIELFFSVTHCKENMILNTQ